MMNYDAIQKGLSFNPRQQEICFHIYLPEQ